MNIFLDIETIPCQSATIRKEFFENDDARLYKSSLDGTFGQIVVAAYAIDDGPTVAVYNEDWQSDTAEAGVLKDLFDALTSLHNPSSSPRPTFVGHNIIGFDLRFIYQRSIQRGIKPPSFFPINAKPWDNNVFDTMTQWAGTGNRVKLDTLCKVLGLSGKGDIDGSKVWDYIQAGRIVEVAEYCKHDVKIVRDVWRRMTWCSISPVLQGGEG